jgi:hypothetical protein
LEEKTPFKQARLDYILISENFTNIVEDLLIKPGYRSDHSIVVVEFKFNSFERGRGLWKFNNLLLYDKVFVEKVKQQIQFVKEQYSQGSQDKISDIDDALFLETLLMEIRGMTISYSSYKKRERDTLETKLTEEINEIEINNSGELGILEEKQKQLENIRKEKLKGHFVRSRAKWIEEGEKPTKYFCHLESRNFLNKTIKKIETQDNGIIYNQSDILKEIKHFYENLYKNYDAELIDINLHDIITVFPKLDKKTSMDLEKQIRESEILQVLKEMKNNKTPGSDGFTSEFFKFFWKDLKIYITGAINQIFEQKYLPITQRLGIISCLPKGDKPRQFLKNWRPITLLNVLYKLISGCISQRIKSTLDYLISNSQTGFIKGRYIGENTRFIYDLMSFTEKHNFPRLLMLIDFEKAFDSISWLFIYKVLDFFGFGNNIITWVKILNTNIKASIIQCGKLSEQFIVQRGCRQGDPIAPYLFILCAEILAILIKQNKDIKGIVINDEEHKISQYADDTSLALDGSEKSLFNALETLEFFSRLSGLKINTSKTKIIWIGSRKFSSDVYHHPRWKLDWGSTSFTLLGMVFSVDLDQIVNLNYSTKIPTIHAMIRQWSRRILTPIGRVTVVKTLLLPKLIHLISSLPNPSQGMITSLTQELFRFIWKSKCDKVKRVTVTQKYFRGGLNMTNINNFILSIKSSWIKKVVSCNQSWLGIFKASYGEEVVKKMLDFGDEYISYLLKNTFNPFWTDVFSSWLKVVHLQLTSNSQMQEKLLDIPVWYNSKIKVGKIHVFVKKWYEKGVKTINDFVDSNGNFLTLDGFKQIFHLDHVCYMQYNSIINSISTLVKKLNVPKELRKHANGPTTPFHYRDILLHKKCTNHIYNIINTQEEIPTSIVKWKSSNLLSGCEDINTKQIFEICFKLTADSAAQWLQYRILHRIIPVKSYLKKIKILDNDICSFCGDGSETIEHVFVSCDKILTLWNQLSMHIYRKTKSRIGFNVFNIIFGDCPLLDANKVINFIILYTKQYIYLCCKQNRSPSLEGVLQYLKLKYEIEHCLSLRNCNSTKFSTMWAAWKSIFE